jgi:outer membrane protein assembly factor BamB
MYRWLLMFFLGLSAAHAGTVIYPSNPYTSPDTSYISGDGLHAIDKQGNRLWVVLTDKHLFDPVVLDAMILVGSSDGLFAVNRHNGEVVWQQGKGRTWFSPVVSNQHAYAGTLDDGVIAVDLSDGQVLWQKRLSGWVYTPAWLNGRLVTGGSDHKLWALDPNDGAVLWEREVTQELVYSPVSLGDSTLVATFDGSIARIDANGDTLWRNHYQAPALHLVTDNERFFSLGLDDHLRVHRSKDGAVVAQRKVMIKAPLGLEFSGNTLEIKEDYKNGLLLGADDLTPVDATGNNNAKPFLPAPYSKNQNL